MRLEGLKNLPDLIKSSWNMEAALPFSTLLSRVEWQARIFKYDIAGFLQWGYNFYNNVGSHDQINPYPVSW